MTLSQDPWRGLQKAEGISADPRYQRTQWIDTLKNYFRGFSGFFRPPISEEDKIEQEIGARIAEYFHLLNGIPGILKRPEAGAERAAQRIERAQRGSDKALDLAGTTVNDRVKADEPDDIEHRVKEVYGPKAPRE
jgi:hypothetical protein